MNYRNYLLIANALTKQKSLDPVKRSDIRAFELFELSTQVDEVRFSRRMENKSAALLYVIRAGIEAAADGA